MTPIRAPIVNPLESLIFLQKIEGIFLPGSQALESTSPRVSWILNKVRFILLHKENFFLHKFRKLNFITFANNLVFPSFDRLISLKN